MKNLPGILILVICLCSCDNTWDGESKDMFRQSCLENANTIAGTQDQANAYCDCVLEKTMKKYPKVADALEHSDSLGTDPEIQGCKSLLGRK